MSKPALSLYAAFHLNLAYSSIEEEQRTEVVQRCYWPLLRLAEKYNLAFGIEATGYTLETAAAIDPSWLDKLRRLTTDGPCEFIGSGYAQIIGPLVPAEVNAANLKFGHQVYEQLLGFRPEIALVNEQAYSAGMVKHYLNARYKAIMMECDNPARFHPEWHPEWRYLPQFACNQNGEKIPIIWNKSIAFQKFQQYAHGEIELHEYIDYITSHLSQTERVFPLYGNDVEIFDFRPGRFQTESPLQEQGEWQRIERLFHTLQSNDNFQFIGPGEVLSFLQNPNAGHLLHLESSSQPIPVKKQEKYNINRWALTGRDDFGINSTCRRIYQGLKAKGDASEKEWLEMCYLWSSDFRTHITEKRWQAYLKRLAAFESKVFVKYLKRKESVEGKPAVIDEPKVRPKSFLQNVNSSVISRNASDEKSLVIAEVDKISLPGFPDQIFEKEKIGTRNHNSGNFAEVHGPNGRFLTIETDSLKLKLNCRRGMAIEELCFSAVCSKPLLRTLPHGYYDDIALGADFYTGHLTFETMGQPKATDLNPVNPEINSFDRWLDIKSMIPLQQGLVEKTIRVFKSEPLVELRYRLRWRGDTCGVLRLGHFTLNPEAFDRASLFFATHNGGYRKEKFYLTDLDLDHSTPISFLVSSNQGIGMTEGEIVVGDDNRKLLIKVNETCSPIGFIAYRNVGNSYFCRLTISLNEIDDTYRKSESRIESLSRPIHFAIAPTACQM